MATTSTGYKRNKHPIAQSFFVDEINGIYCTKVDLFFAAKDASFPVSLQIRPMVNGQPSSDQILPGTHIVKAGTAVNTSTDATVATTFEFTEPVFLKGLTDFALVITADSPDYQIYIAQTNEFLVGSTEKRVDRQPVLGSLFYSQNGATFTAAQNQDLTFKLHQAKFRTGTNGLVSLSNASLPKTLLDPDPISVTSTSTTVTVAHYNHGMQVGQTVNISGVDSAGVGGISFANLTGNRSITKIDASGYQYTAGAAADSDVIGGGINVQATKNIPFSIIYPNVSFLKPNSTEIQAGVKGTTSRSYGGTETSFQKQSQFSDLVLNDNNEANELYMVANAASETAELGAGVRSLDMQLQLISDDNNVSPMIDMQRVSAGLINYVIDNQTSASDAITFVDETDAGEGSSASKHITRVVELQEDAVGAKVIFTANRPPSSSISVYYRFANADEVITDKSYVLVSEETANPADENKLTFREYQYLIGGQGGDIPAFQKMQFKFVFKSTNQARVPVMKDLRIIALSV